MLSADLLEKIDGYWRAANYLSVGQIYLRDNPLLKQPLALEHIKPRLLGHWGTTPGLNFIYAHMNRVIRQTGIRSLFVTGPGHGAPGIVANSYLEGSYSEHYPEISQDAEGLRKLFEQFSWPGGIPSHTASTTPGSIHEGGELGYSLTHAFGAVFDNQFPGLFHIDFVRVVSQHRKIDYRRLLPFGITHYKIPQGTHGLRAQVAAFDNMIVHYFSNSTLLAFTVSPI